MIQTIVAVGMLFVLGTIFVFAIGVACLALSDVFERWLRNR